MLILLLLLPMMLFHYWAQAIGPLPPLLFWLFLVFPLVLFFLLGRPEEEPQQVLAEAQEVAEQGEQELPQQAALIAQLKSLAAAEFAIQTTRYEAGQIVFEGVMRGGCPARLRRPGALVCTLLTAVVAQGSQLLRVALARDNGPDDPLPGSAHDIAEGLRQLDVHLQQRLLHVEDMGNVMRKKLGYTQDGMLCPASAAHMESRCRGCEGGTR